VAATQFVDLPHKPFALEYTCQVEALRTIPGQRNSSRKRNADAVKVRFLILFLQRKIVAPISINKSITKGFGLIEKHIEEHLLKFIG
jgi:hypothetical protein